VLTWRFLHPNSFSAIPANAEPPRLRSQAILRCFFGGVEKWRENTVILANCGGEIKVKIIIFSILYITLRDLASLYSI
jgi:hypothetical protein